MRNLLLAFLSRDWAGLAIAVMLGGVGALLSGAVFEVPPWSAWLGWPLMVVAAVLGLGAARHIMTMASIRDRNPAPGRLVDVGGYRMHLLAEGEAKGRPTIVWLSGGHAGGFAMFHLHRALRVQTRSILVDRPGTGWSDIGPFPRRTALEAEEVLKALERSGETGPFIFAGHSFGGLLAANIARRRPDLTAHVVLLDATPLDVPVYGPRLGNFKAMRTTPAVHAALRLFGVHHDFASAAMEKTPEYKMVMEKVNAQLLPDAAPSRALNLGARGGCAEASIYEEFSPEYLGPVAWETCVYDGDLDGVSVVLVAPGSMRQSEFDALPLASGAVADKAASEAMRMKRFFERTRERYMAASDRARRVYAPDGTGHNFIYEAPDFTIGVFHDLLG